MGRFGPYDVLRVPARVTRVRDDYADHRNPLTMAASSMASERSVSASLGIEDIGTLIKYPFPGIVDQSPFNSF